MTDEPPKAEDDKEAEARFNETLGRLVNTPPKPHKPTDNSKSPKEPRAS